MLPSVLLVACAAHSVEEGFDAFLSAHRRHDTGAVLACLSEDYRLVFVDHDAVIDREGLVPLLSWDRGCNGRLRYEDLEVRGDTVRVVLIEGNDFLELLGIDELRARCELVFDARRRIREQTYEVEPGQPSWQDALRPALEWARVHRAEELAALSPDGELAYTEESARRWIALLSEWRRESERPPQVPFEEL